MHAQSEKNPFTKVFFTRIIDCEKARAVKNALYFRLSKLGIYVHTYRYISPLFPSCIRHCFSE